MMLKEAGRAVTGMILLTAAMIIMVQGEVKAQGAVSQKAMKNELMNHFVDASDAYRGLYSRGDREASLQAARNLYKARRYEEALPLYEYADSLKMITDADQVFAFFECLKSVKRYEEADVLVKSRLGEFSERPEFGLNQAKVPYYNRLVSYKGVELKALPLNTKYSDISPAVFGNWLYFVSTRPATGNHTVHRINMQPFYNIYGVPLSQPGPQVALPQGEFGAAAGKIKLGQEEGTSIPKGVNRKYHDGPVSVTPSGRYMFFTTNFYEGRKSKESVNLMIYWSEFKDGVWSEMKSLPSNSTEYSNQHGYFDEKTSTLYFASNRAGGKGGWDIWKSKLDGSGNWSEAENLGDGVNTVKTEVFPGMSPDGQLVFASNGWPGLGGLDLFLAQGGGKSPLNMLAGLNSERDDFGLIFTGKNAGYLVSNRPGGAGDDDIYSFTMNYDIAEIKQYNRYPVNLAVSLLSNAQNSNSTQPSSSNLNSGSSSNPINTATAKLIRDGVEQSIELKNGMPASLMEGDQISVQAEGYKPAAVTVTEAMTRDGKLGLNLEALPKSTSSASSSSEYEGRIAAENLIVGEISVAEPENKDKELAEMVRSGSFSMIDVSKVERSQLELLSGLERIRREQPGFTAEFKELKGAEVTAVQGNTGSGELNPIYYNDRLYYNSPYTINTTTATKSGLQGYRLMIRGLNGALVAADGKFEGSEQMSAAGKSVGAESTVSKSSSTSSTTSSATTSSSTSSTSSSSISSSSTSSTSGNTSTSTGVAGSVSSSASNSTSTTLSSIPSGLDDKGYRGPVNVSREGNWLVTPDGAGNYLLSERSGEVWKRPELVVVNYALSSNSSSSELTTSTSTSTSNSNSSLTSNSSSNSNSANTNSTTNTVSVGQTTNNSSTGLAGLSSSSSSSGSTSEAMRYQSAYYDESTSTLYFASDRYAGYGGYDLWKMTKLNGKWSEAVNLGASVNTEKDEINPFVSHDGYLLFSSNGWTGLGGYDIHAWRKEMVAPVNLLSGINSKNDDVGAYVSSDGKGYFSSNRAGGRGGFDVYNFKWDILSWMKSYYGIKYRLPASETDGIAAGTVLGYFDGLGEDRERLSLAITEADQVPTRQYYRMAGRWLVTSKKVSYSNNALRKVTVSGKSRRGRFISRIFEAWPDRSVAVTTVAKPRPEPGNLHTVLYFRFGKLALRYVSIAAAQQLAKDLQADPGLVLDLSVHSDCMGSEAANQRISDRRADWLVGYIEKLAPAASGRITAKGYGETIPAVQCECENFKTGNACKRKQNDLNRRAEFVVMKK